MIRKDVYYENFSKFLLNSDHLSKKTQEIYPYSKWISDPKSIHTIQLKILKTTLKMEKCKTYGNKPVLILRLNAVYTRIKSATTIQRIFRGFLVRETERLRGPAANDLSVCTNDTDFETMNPLYDIPKRFLFSYRDDRGFVYGFNLFSLIKILAFSQNNNYPNMNLLNCEGFAEHKNRFVNPYNREDISLNVLQSLFSIYRKVKIIYNL
jgi:hypothetical protein